MNIKRIIAIAAIFMLACGGWVILGLATEERSVNSSQKLGGKVEGLYGAALVQQAPSFSIQVPGSDQTRQLMPSRNDIKVVLASDYRKKGLIWYPTYKCSFESTYTISNADLTSGTGGAVQKVRVHFDFPAKGGTYDNFAIMVDDKPLLVPIDTRTGINQIIELARGQSRTFHIRYNTRGLGEWHYQLDPQVGRVQNFNLAVETDFENFDYPEGSWSATGAREAGSGMALEWKTSDLITSQDIGVMIPEKLNPGPLTTRITYFAPVCLLFFFVLVMTINILYRVNIHPMHYLFVAAGFFAFHLLLSYLAGIVNIHGSFLLSAITSVALVTSYLSAALKGKFPWKIAIAGQIFFLVLFSYSFFLKGITGLTVAIGSVVTLAILMRVTAHIDWNEVFTRPSPIRPPKLPLAEPRVGAGEPVQTA